MKIREVHHICDICKVEIKNYSPGGNVAINGIGHNQIWPIGERRYDVCYQCASILALAKGLGIVTYDEEPLYRQAGFEWDEERGCWYHPQTGLSRYLSKAKGDQ
jgi:hypothetical protein